MNAPLALTRRGLGCALGAVTLWASWLVIGLRDVWYLVALLAALAVVSLVVAGLLAWRARPEIRLSPTDPTPTVGAPVSLTATVKHRSPFPFHAAVIWEVAEQRMQSPFTARAGGRAITTGVRWVPTRRGPVKVRIAAIEVADPMGLAMCRVRSRQSASLLVLPQPLESFAALLEAPGSRDAGGTRPRPRLRQGTGAPSGSVRAYRSGDALREVHWKQSARQGELLVNLHEQTDHPERSLLLDTDPEAYRSAPEFDLGVSAAATLAGRWLREGHTVRLGLGNAHPMLFSSEGEMLRALALARLDGAVGSQNGGWKGPLPVVLTGEVTERLANWLSRAPLHRGTVYVLRENPIGHAPKGWRQVPIPGRHVAALEAGAGGSRS